VLATRRSKVQLATNAGAIDPCSFQEARHTHKLMLVSWPCWSYRRDAARTRRERGDGHRSRLAMMMGSRTAPFIFRCHAIAWLGHNAYQTGVKDTRDVSDLHGFRAGQSRGRPKVS
jgi:hypothetical protein